MGTGNKKQGVMNVELKYQKYFDLDCSKHEKRGEKCKDGWIGEREGGKDSKKGDSISAAF